ncbi:unnamed protein product [Caenorhabditis sp. 36 PRJEB53466]|nr:unnamed protein product [Caenorhabditis sp. 36 PRJEB53466]
MYSHSNRNTKNDNRPRIRVFSFVRKMNPNQQQLARVPKQESAGSGRRYAQQQQQHQSAPTTRSQQNGSGGGAKGSQNGKVSSSMTIEEVPNHAFLESINNSATPTNSNNKVDEEKLPVFLIKLWNIVEDNNLQNIVHWDESGASFHIADPYSFCRNVLPHYFKHNNLNSLIRQLNMYGFRKMTPLSQGGLTRTESDQDHLEFSHPFFLQNRPELLCQIKRKQSAKVVEDKQASEQTQQNLEVMMAEMRMMRDKARNMESKMNSLTKENRDIWEQMHTMRQQHTRQQQNFKKLLHFLVSVMQPGLSKRVAKRGVLEIASASSSSAKRPRNSDDGPYKDVCDLLESLQRESQESQQFRRFSQNDCGPLISEVTDEFGNSPGARSGGGDMFSDAFGVPRYPDSSSSREPSPHPTISQPSSSSAAQTATAYDDNIGSSGRMGAKSVYMGSGALTHENVHRANVGAKRDYQGVSTSSAPPPPNPQMSMGKAAPGSGRRAPYKTANRQMTQQTQPIPPIYPTVPPQIAYQPQPPPQHQQQQQQHQNQLARLEDDPHQDLYSPTLAINPSLDRSISNELQEYFTGYDSKLDNLRDMMANSNWESFGDYLPEDEEDEQDHLQFLQQHQQQQQQQQYPMHQQLQHQQPLALENGPDADVFGEEDVYADGEDLLDPLLSDVTHPENGFEVPLFQHDANYAPLADEELFPRSPLLRTPSPGQ